MNRVRRSAAVVLLAAAVGGAAGCGGATEAVTTTVSDGDFLKRGAGAPAKSVQFGHIASLRKTGQDYELRFDPAMTLAGITANTAAAEDGAVAPGEPVPNDYYTIDEGHRLLTYRVPAGAHVSVLTKGVEATEITVAELAELVAGTSDMELWEPITTGFWALVDIDTVLSLDQQYRP